MKIKSTIVLATGAAMLALTVTSQAEDGKALYTQQCAKCHGADGKGQTKMGAKLNIKDYTDAKVQAEMKDDKAIKVIKEGLIEGGKVLMKPGEGITDAQAKAMVDYMRTFKK